MRTFLAGQRVRMTPLALGQGLRSKKNPKSLGTVVRDNTANSGLVIVRQDGLKQSSTYSVDFWESASALCPFCRK